MTFHGLRRSAGAHWLELGLSLLEVSRLLGHRSITTTERWYAGVHDSTLVSAIAQELGTERPSMRARSIFRKICAPIIDAARALHYCPSIASEDTTSEGERGCRPEESTMTTITTYTATATILVDNTRVNATVWPDNARSYSTTDRAALDAEIEAVKSYCDAEEEVEVTVTEETVEHDLVLVEVMPRHLRASHEAAGNRGTYPANRAQRYLVERGEAEALVDDWTEIVRDARQSDVGEYDLDIEGRQVATV